MSVIKVSLLFYTYSSVILIYNFFNLCFRQLVKRHRLVCQHELSESSNLSSLVKQNHMNDTQRKSLFDINNTTTKLGM